MLEPHYDEPPTAHAEIEIRLGAALPSLTARATVPGPDAKRLVRLIGFVVTVLAVGSVAGVSAWIGVSTPIVVLLAVAAMAFGAVVTLRE